MHDLIRHRQCTRGFTLVETLVALVIMGVGMLGIAALYVEGLRANRTAVYRTTAVMLAADMAERIRANHRAGPEYEDGSGTADPQVAEDRSDWLGEIGRRLPAGATGTIDADIAMAAAPPLPALMEYTITISWPETGREGNVDYQLEFQR